jgi:hypothetical protein
MRELPTLVGRLGERVVLLRSRFGGCRVGGEETRGCRRERPRDRESARPGRGDGAAEGGGREARHLSGWSAAAEGRSWDSGEGREWTLAGSPNGFH